MYCTNFSNMITYFQKKGLSKYSPGILRTSDFLSLKLIRKTQFASGSTSEFPCSKTAFLNPFWVGHKTMSQYWFYKILWLYSFNSFTKMLHSLCQFMVLYFTSLIYNSLACKTKTLVWSGPQLKNVEKYCRRG